MSLLGAISVSASGMEAQRVRLELLSENLAHTDTTRVDGPGSGPYRRKDAVFSAASPQSTFADMLSGAGAGGSAGVVVSEISVDQSEPERRYLPGHPDADANGYVAFPKISPAEEMVNMMSASRSYEANVAAISTVKDMIARSLDLFK